MRDDEYVMIDSTSVRVRQYASGSDGGQIAQPMGC